ncbi:hypothetical protein ES703_83192 [subsurface metagenome]
MAKNTIKLIWCVIFAIAMAYLESAAVIYLRLLYYPAGFQFPSVEIPLSVFLTEMGREAATIVMIFSLARLLSRNTRERAAYFIFCFGVWDIFFYIWLKLLLNWPKNLMDWDILFLIPLSWVGPVLSPVIISLIFILSAITILQFESRKTPINFTTRDWLLELSAGLIIISSYLWETDNILKGTKPEVYPWWLWGIGVLIGLSIFIRRILKASSKKGY